MPTRGVDRTLYYGFPAGDQMITGGAGSDEYQRTTLDTSNVQHLDPYHTSATAVLPDAPIGENAATADSMPSASSPGGRASGSSKRDGAQPRRADDRGGQVGRAGFWRRPRVPPGPARVSITW